MVGGEVHEAKLQMSLSYKNSYYMWPYGRQESCDEVPPQKKKKKKLLPPDQERSV